MPNETIRTDVLSVGWPTATILVVALLLLACWWLACRHRQLLGRTRPARIISLLVQLLVGSFASWFVFNLAARFVVFQSGISFWLMALLLTVGVQLVLSLYRLEAGIVPAGLGRLLVGLRIALIVLVMIMLMQPVFSWSEDKTHEKFIAVLLDDSASMYLADKQLTDSEKLQLVMAFAPDQIDRPYDFSILSNELRRVSDELANEAGAMAELFTEPSDDQQQRWTVATEQLGRTIQTHRQALTRQIQNIDQLVDSGMTLSSEGSVFARRLLEQLRGEVVARLVDLETSLQESASNPRSQLQSVTNLLKGASDQLRGSIVLSGLLVDQADRSYMASLPADKLKEIDELAKQTRAQLARGLLAGDGDARVGVIKQIADQYTPRLYVFHSTTSTAELDDLPAVDDEDGAAEQRATQDPDRLVTDMVTALDQARTDIPAAQLAGVLLVSDGRHNAAGDMDESIRKLGAVGVPVSALVLGSARPPIDAAVIDLQTPPTVLVDDQLTIDARVKLTGMSGRTVRVRLMRDGEPVDEELLSVVQDELVQTVKLQDVPNVEGVRVYEVKIEPIQGDSQESEAFQSNNQRETRVAVTDDRTQVLIIEGRPRWEYRYLRTLLASRDTSVQLQTVLLQPDHVADLTDIPQVHAAVARADDEIEATLLPENEAEWFKFDVVVLGDVAPAMLGTDTLDILDRFVNRRGGALVVVAGRNYMPHAYVSTSLVELLPHTFLPIAGATPVDPDAAFQLALTRVGYRHSITRQGETYDENRQFWETIPPLYWRHQVIESKPGAVVLAYALSDSDKQLLAAVENETADQTEQRLVLQQQHERKHPLLTIQQLGAGRVMMLNTDRTWRLRYRTGDRFHHRLWGQVLRWAESQKLQAGTSFVRIGTDKTVYQQDEALTISVRLTDSYLAPLVDPDATVKIFQDEKLVLSEPLSAVADSDGMYSATLSKLPGHGEYRVVLESPEATRVLAGEGVDTIETWVSVLPPQINTQELNEMTVDLTNLARWSNSTGGAVYNAANLSNVLDTFGTGTLNYTEETRRTIWDSWIWLTLMVVVVTAEWLLRKRGGLV